MTADQLLARIAAHTAPTILDVRTRAEFARGHVPGALHVPFWKVIGGAPVPASPGDPVVIYCGHGPRAWLAGDALRRRGFERVEYLEGHMSGWRGAGHREEL